MNDGLGRIVRVCGRRHWERRVEAAGLVGESDNCVHDASRQRRRRRIDCIPFRGGCSGSPGSRCRRCPATARRSCCRRSRGSPGHGPQSVVGLVSPAIAQHGVAASTSVWSVLTVPLLSTGEGSTVAGYGLGGGTRWSEALEDLGDSISTRVRL